MNTKFLIGEAAQYLGVSKDTLRYYHKENILKPSMIGSNGYRYYVAEDIIKLTYIITFRQLDISVREIKEMIANYTLQELDVLMQQKEAEIDNKISKLKSLKKTISNFKDDINRSINLLNKIEIVNSPYILYEEIESDMDLNTYKKMEKLSGNIGISAVTFSSLINKKIFKNNDLEGNIIYAISGIKEDSIYYQYEDEYKIYKYDKCIHTVLKTELEMKHQDIQYIKDYLEEKKVEVLGDSIARFITFENKNNKAYDYIEIWIPIK